MVLLLGTVLWDGEECIVFNIILCNIQPGMKLRLQDHLCFRLYVASRLIVQGYGEELRSINLTYLKYLVLLALSEKNGQTVGQLGALLSLDSGTLSPLLKSLSDDGYIVKKRLRLDERTVASHLTSKGRKACSEGCRIAFKLFEATGFSKEAHYQLCAEMDDFIKRAKNILAKQPNGKKVSVKNIKREKESHASLH